MDNVYVLGSNVDQQLGLKKKTTKVEQVHETKYIKYEWKKVIRSLGYTVLLNDEGEVYVCSGSQKTKQEFDEKIKDIACGVYHYLALTEEGRVYSWSIDGKDENEKGYEYGQLGHGAFERCDDPQEMGFFEDQVVVAIACGAISSLFLLENSSLYVCGSGVSLGLEYTEDDQAVPQLIAQRVKAIYASTFSAHAFYLTENHELRGFGMNHSNQLGIDPKYRQDQRRQVHREGRQGWGSNQKVRTQIPKMVTFEHTRSIRDVVSTKSSSFILTTQGELFSCGAKEMNGSNQFYQTFTKVPQLAGHKVVAIGTGPKYAIAGLQNGKFYYLGSNIKIDYLVNHYNAAYELRCTMPTFGYIKKITCVAESGAYLLIEHDPIRKDMFNLWKSKSKNKCTDCTIKKIGFHSKLVQARLLDNQIDDIKQILEECHKQEIKELMKWVYYDQIDSPKLLQTLLTKFDINQINRNYSIKTIFSRLYNQPDERKNFSILLSNREYVSAHRVVLLARSDYFKKILVEKRDHDNRIKDYTLMSTHEMRWIMSYIYGCHQNIEKNVLKRVKNSFDFYSFFHKEEWEQALNQETHYKFFEYPVNEQLKQKNEKVKKYNRYELTSIDLNYRGYKTYYDDKWEKKEGCTIF
ncbi:btk-binding protein-related [Anaeramoeba flamelloides]|uniref:Btk-binding protein-related n=1 Tax=Anaeramoeba flamelloides TaxID=1746091 RepID=A0AAV7ZEZ7_9EUKA|nr:btk-binding protein-related [Anaeramoeba flamelloides]